LLKNGEIDRKKLADIVFSDKNKLERLNKITHPCIIKEIKNRVSSSNEEFIVLDVPLLIEADMLKMVDKLIVVKADRRVVMKRLSKRYSKGEILKRIKSQLSLNGKVKVADYVIDNSKSLKDTKKQINEIWKKIARR
jgi:dephospho-CoA kinase